MNHTSRLSLLVVLLSAACGVDSTTEVVGSEQDQDVAQVDQGLTALPAGYVVNPGTVSVALGRCVVTLGTATLSSGGPPTSLVWMSRSGLLRTCTVPRSVMSSPSYTVPHLALIAVPSLNKLVMSHDFKPTPSGSSHVQAVIRLLDSSFNVTKSASLNTVINSYGDIDAPSLSLSGNDLYAIGTATGHFPGETGSGPNYRAFYPAFLTSPGTSAAWAWVVRF